MGLRVGPETRTHLGGSCIVVYVYIAIENSLFKFVFLLHFFVNESITLPPTNS